METVIGIGVGVPVGIFLMLGLAIARAGSLSKAFAGLAIAGRANQEPAFAAKLQALLSGAEIKPAGPPKPAKPSGAPLRLLALLQAESRLVDFLMDDLQQASDEQIVAAAREVHRKAQKALKDHAVIEQVLPGNEGENTTVQKGFDPSAIRVVGNVTGEPPFTGAINHPGWRVKELKLATPAEGIDEFVLQPAEVQLP
jgi:hypothetical protein